MGERFRNSGIWNVLTDIIDLIFAGLLWLLCSLPIITIGPASVALYYTVVKSIKHERGRLVASFFGTFKREFKQSFLIWLIFLAYIVIGIFNMNAVKQLGLETGSTLYYMSRIFFVPALLLFPWVFSFISRFNNTVAGTLKFAAYLTLKNIGRSLLLAAELCLFGLLVYLIPQLLPILPGMFCLRLSVTIEPVFKQITLEAQDDENIDQWYND